MAESKREYRYIQFPLCLLQLTYEKPYHGFDLIISYGIINYSQKFSYTIEEVGRQLMYAYYRNQKMIQADLLKTMQRYIDNEELTIEENYCGFGTGGKNFDPFAFEDCELLTLFERDEKFKEAAIIRYQIQQAAKSLNIQIGSIDKTIKRYNEGLKIKYSFEQRFGKDSEVSLKIGMAFKLRDSQIDLDLFRANLAIKSKIGTKDFATISKPEIVSRMIGCKSVEAFNHCKAEKHLKPTVEKYSKRYQMNKILDKLVERRFIMYLSKQGERSIYVSKYIEPENLKKLIEKPDTKTNILNRRKAVSATLFNNKSTTSLQQ